MSKYKVERVDVWVSGLRDRSGALAKAFATLSDAGADLEFVIARRTPTLPGGGVVFFTPIVGEQQEAAARALGADVVDSVQTLRVEGENAAGQGAKVAGALAAAEINMHGFSAAVIGDRFVAYIGFDSEADASKAEAVLAAL